MKLKIAVLVMNSSMRKRWWVPVLLMPVTMPILMRLMMYACVLMQSCSLLLAI